MEIKKPDLQKHVQQLAKTKKTLVNEMKEPKRKVRSVPIELDYFFKIQSIRVISVFDYMSDGYFIVANKNDDKLITNQTLPAIVENYKFIKKEMLFEGGEFEASRVGFIVLYYDDNFIKNEII